MVVEVPENIHIVPYIQLEKLKQRALNGETEEELEEDNNKQIERPQIIEKEPKKEHIEELNIIAPSEDSSENEDECKVKGKGKAAIELKKDGKITITAKKSQNKKRKNILQIAYDKIKNGIEFADFTIPELFVGVKYYHSLKPKRNFDEYKQRAMKMDEEKIEKLREIQHHCSICTFIDIKHDLDKFMQSTLVSRENILEYNAISTDDRNGYCIIKHERYKEITMYINGTQTIKDVMTDMNSNSVRFCEGWAHAGMAVWAKWFEENKRETLKACLELNPGYKLKLVGHSLGGGVAALLGMLLKEEFPDLKVLCIAIPKCVSENLAQETLNYITSIVYMDDFVPLLSLTTVADLRRRVALCNWKHQAYKDLSKSALIGALKKIGVFSKKWESIGETDARNKSKEELEEELELKIRLKKMNEKEKIAYYASIEEQNEASPTPRTSTPVKKVKPLNGMRSRSISSPPVVTQVVSSATPPESVEIFGEDDEEEEMVPLHNPGVIYYIRVIENDYYMTKETYASPFLQTLEFNRNYLTDHYCETYRNGLDHLIQHYYQKLHIQPKIASTTMLDFKSDLFD